METDYDKMLESVMAFVSEKLCIDKSKLSENTKIEEDVGIAGLDTLSFYDDFFAKFAISNPSDFNADKYVTSDNLEIGLLVKSIFSQTAREKLRIQNNTIRHLTNVAMTRKWVEV